LGFYFDSQDYGILDGDNPLLKRISISVSNYSAHRDDNNYFDGNIQCFFIKGLFREASLMKLNDLVIVSSKNKKQVNQVKEEK